jgi:F-type H+-transporting ATPase subunit b
MDEILNQLAALLLGAVPTMLLFIVLVLAYTFLVRKPLNAILAERRSRTVGAVTKATEAIAAAEANTQKYEAAIHSARSQAFAAREQRIRQWASEREATVTAARAAAQQRVAVARKEIEASAETARQQVKTGADALIAQILKAVLPAGLAGSL